METFERATIRKHIRNIDTVKISLVGAVSLAGFILSICNIASGNFLFSLWYFAAFSLALAYVVIKINTIFPISVSVDDEKLILTTWNNGVMPYTIPEKPRFFSDFIPDKIKTDEILLKDIDSLYLGSDKLFEKQLEEKYYPEILTRLKQDEQWDSIIKRMDFLVVIAKDGNGCFMSITNFSTTELTRVLDVIERNVSDVNIYTNISRLIKKREKIKNSLS